MDLGFLGFGNLGKAIVGRLLDCHHALAASPAALDKAWDISSSTCSIDQEDFATIDKLFKKA